MTAMTLRNRNKVVLVAAFTAGTLGVAGLVGLALPGGAESAPALPPVSAQELVDSVATATPPAMAGVIEVDNALGLPAIPGLPSQLANGEATARVWYDGADRSRVSLPSGGGEQTMVDDGTTVWTWDPASRTVHKADDAETERAAEQAGEAKADPTTMAREILGIVQETSDVSVDGTAEVAGRPAYELVLAPAPTERSLLREVRVAVDSETRLPLRLSVYANGATEPVLSVAFTEFSVGPQADSLFTFTPPADATVVEGDAATKERDLPGDGPEVPEPTAVGDGWDTVLVTTVPAELLEPQRLDGEDGPGPGGAETIDPRALLRQLGTPVEGTWGSGTLISTTVVSAIVTDDGRVAVGAVPQQVLIEALSR